MFAIFTTGSKQYKVSQNDVIYTEKLEGSVGDTVEFKDVLAIGAKYGKPYLKGAKVICEIQKQDRAPKIIIIKHRPQKHHTKTQGHRQPYTKLIVKEVIHG
ncbi:MAG: 50S ribosomal protein L21 [Mycoplasmataceae bacterium]|jgi:large subunit ribosomal protein L21|nr:50S ribosomal protein L21 [Mycoplasmataceae bacterium]